MKLLSILALFLFSFSLQAQTVNGIAISELDVEYVQIVGTKKPLSQKITIKLDFGQKKKALSHKNQQVMDANGKKVVFNSMIDALNFMSRNGFQFVEAYTLSIGNQNVYHYLLKKS